MTNAAIARFLTEHPDWSPTFATLRGKMIVDGFRAPSGKFISATSVQAMMILSGKVKG